MIDKKLFQESLQGLVNRANQYPLEKSPWIEKMLTGLHDYCGSDKSELNPVLVIVQMQEMLKEFSEQKSDLAAQKSLVSSQLAFMKNAPVSGFYNPLILKSLEQAVNNVFPSYLQNTKSAELWSSMNGSRSGSPDSVAGIVSAPTTFANFMKK